MLPTAEGLPVANVARWNGTSWQPLGTGVGSFMGDSVRSLSSYGGDLFAAGQFAMAGSATVNGIARWDGSGWSIVGAGLGQLATVYALAVMAGS